MKLPSGPLDGAIPLDWVLRALHDHSVKIHKVDGVTYVEKGDELQAQLFTPAVPRYIVKTLSVRFGIPITDFYDNDPFHRGLMIEDPEDD